MHSFAVHLYRMLEKIMPRTASGGDGHDHDYQLIHNRHMTSMDGENPHSHVVPAWPATRTSMSNGHDHELPERASMENPLNMPGSAS